LCTSVFTPSSRDAESPVHVVSPEQFSAAEQRHEQERIIAKHIKEKEVAKDTEALRVSIEQLREVFYSNCQISRVLIGSFLSSIRVQTDKILICASFQVQLSAVKLPTF